MKLRPSDKFHLVVHRGSEKEPLLRRFLRDCETSNYSLTTTRISRRFSNLMALFRFPNYCAIKETADVFLSPNSNYLGGRAKPTICNVFDISAMRNSRHASMPWHGVRIRRFELQLLGGDDSWIIATSEFTKNDLLDYDPRFRNRTTVIPCGIDEVWFENFGTKINVERFGLARPYWIWYGYVTKRKNVDGLLRGYARLRKTQPREICIPDLALVGTLGKDSQDIPELAASLGIQKCVRFVPFQPPEPDKLVALVANSSGLVFPSHYEGFGLPCIEAMALGRPALVADRSCQPEISGGLAELCDPNDTNSIAEALAKMLAADQCSPEKVSARRRWASRFSHHEAALRYSELVDRVIFKKAC